MSSTVAAKFAKLGIHQIQDLVFHLPLRYQDRSRLWCVADLQAGVEALCHGTIIASKVVMGARRALQVTIEDQSGTLALRFFYFSYSQQQALKTGAHIQVFGQARHLYRPERIGSHAVATLEMIHPEYHILTDAVPILSEHLTPIYPTTNTLTQRSIRSAIAKALDLFRQHYEDDSAYLPQDWQYSLPEALAIVHNPPPDISVALLQQGQHSALRRVAFEELLAQHLAAKQIRQQHRAQQAPRCSKSPAPLMKQWQQNLPFALTGAQKRVIGEILADLAQSHPAMRLIQGDVGCGKTAVACAAALQAVASGWQVVFLAPTELLAEQHFANLSQWCAPLGVKVGFLASKMGAPARKQALQQIQDGSAQIVTGTHALFQNEVSFAHLGLLIIDEQHRFGVGQRAALRDKALTGERAPHQLIMTATPIPRSLAMTSYANLDISIIDEHPSGRLPITTVVMSNERRDALIARIASACQQGAQAYWVCTLIEESTSLQNQAAEQSAAQLRAALPQINIGLVHGKMKSAEKSAILAQFKAGALGILVATTVIEVGVDVANASLMIIENAERLGLAQLHQLRGRVGRGSQKSSCVLLYQAPLGKVARERLETMRQCADGFAIAEKDLALRGAGDFLGTRQTGEQLFKIADAARDADMLEQVAQVAAKIPAEHAQIIIRRWLGSLPDFAQV